MTKNGPRHRGHATHEGEGEVILVCFRAGGISFALPAAEVGALEPPRAEVRHLAALLGLDEGQEASGRTLRLTDGAHEITLRVDGPVELHAVGLADIVAAPESMTTLGPVMGFARVGDDLVQLLDLPQIVRAKES